MRKILIAEDVHANRTILRRMLCNEYEVLEAVDGVETMEVLHREGADLSLVLLDLDMPRMDGYEVLKAMQAEPDLSVIPVIVATGTTESSAEVKALSMGAQDFVVKPYSSSVIRHRVANTIKLRETAATINALKRDRLTGLLNREFFFAEVTKMVKAHEPGYYVMACFDVDKFKVINDQYGSQMGDAVLKHIGSMFTKIIDHNGGLCCRIAADNFAALYPAKLQDSGDMRRIHEKAAHVDGLIAPIIFSIGRYVVEDVHMSPQGMYDRASLAADSVKGRYDMKIAQYDESMRQRLVRNQEIVFEMEKALKSQQFEVWFQPQYNHSTGAMIGAEALVRWRHPEKGLIPPNDFIPIFEQNGFVYALDQFVWHKTCQYLRKWRDEGKDPQPISVNISRYDVLCPDVVSVLTEIVRKNQIPEALLHLEITESAFSESTDRIIGVVQELIDLGFVVEIDDFGSGYSSLNTLKDVPAQIVKLDMRFFDRSHDSQRSGNVVESVVRMAKWLNMSVIAEGVETKVQADFLRSIGCNYIQGYLYARPMPADQYEVYLTESKKEDKRFTLETVTNMDNNSFWDPASLETLIFNRFVGSAGIYEYHNGNIELIRANEKYVQTIGGVGMTVEDAIKRNWMEHLDEENRQRIMADLEEAIATKQEVTGEYTFLDLPGCPHETFLRFAMRIIATAGIRYLVYCTSENLTAQRQAQRREQEATKAMRLILSQISNGIIAGTYTPEGGFHTVYANDNFYAMCGYTKAQMESELDDGFQGVHPDDRKQTIDIVAKLMREGGSARHSCRWIKGDGSVITVSCNSTAIFLASANQPVLLSVIIDVTE